ncbi:hypothetical protein KFE25_012966 [Diacronema lutheri]|uniref:Uncharacterized protein n=2 Tax=Diacronema lutheri TaxID=2081491 RepID=A0A8J6C8T7_DIALT|nr:hypothetical protein KFE25_012966 [Diacronema lutheri]
MAPFVPRAARALSTAATGETPARARHKSVLTPEFGVMLGMSAWGVYCAMRVLRAKSQFAAELLEAEEALAHARAHADGLAKQNTELLRALDEAHETLATARTFSVGTTARALRILRDATASAVAPADARVGVGAARESVAASDPKPADSAGAPHVRVQPPTMW